MQVHFTIDEIKAKFNAIQSFPQIQGTVELIVARPAPGEREILQTCTLEKNMGLLGDNWINRGSHHTTDGEAYKNHQITLINSKIIHILAGVKSRWPLAGDQFYVDFDLGVENLPAGTLLQLGTAIIQIDDKEYLAKGKFTKRFGVDASRFVNSKLGRRLRLRGVRARIINEGTVNTGDKIFKL